MVGLAPVMIAQSARASDDVDVLPGEFSSPALPSNAQTSPSEAPELPSIRIGGAGDMANLSIGLGRTFKNQVPGANVEISSRDADSALDDVLNGDLDLAAIDRPLTANERALGLVAVPLGSGLAYVFNGSTPSSTVQPFLDFIDDPANESSIQQAVAAVQPAVASTDVSEEPSSSSSSDGEDPNIAAVDTAEPEPSEIESSEIEPSEIEPSEIEMPESDVEAVVPSLSDTPDADVSSAPPATSGTAPSNESVAVLPNNELPDGRPGGVVAQKPFPWWWLLFPLLLGLPLLAWLSRGRQSSTPQATSSPETENPPAPPITPPLNPQPSTDTNTIAAASVATATALANNPPQVKPTPPAPQPSASSTASKQQTPTAPSRPAVPKPRPGISSDVAAAGAVMGAAGAIAAGKKPATDANKIDPNKIDPNKADANKIKTTPDADAVVTPMSAQENGTGLDTHQGQTETPLDSESVLQNLNGISTTEHLETDTILPISPDISQPSLEPDSPDSPLLDSSPDIASLGHVGPGAIAAGLGAAGLGLVASQFRNDTEDANAESTAAFAVPPAVTAQDIDNGTSDDAFARPVTSVSQFLIKPSPEQGLFVQWDMSEEQRQTLFPQDEDSVASGLQLKVYDVTGIDLDHHPAHDVQLHAVPTTAFDGNTARMTVPVPTGDRDYLAEVGHVTPDNQWMSLGRSLHTYVPTPVGNAANLSEDTLILPLVMDGTAQVDEATPIPIITTDEQMTQNYQSPLELDAKVDDSSSASISTSVNTNTAAFVGAVAGLGVAGLGLAALSHEQADDSSDEPEETLVLPTSTATDHPSSAVDPVMTVSQLRIEPASATDLSIQWQTPEDQRMAFMQQGDRPLQLKVYDVTGINLDHQPAHDVQLYSIADTAFDGSTASMTVPIPTHDRDYLAEIGYTTPDNTWMSLGRSLHTYVPAPEGDAEETMTLPLVTDRVASTNATVPRQPITDDHPSSDHQHQNPSAPMDAAAGLGAAGLGSMAIAYTNHADPYTEKHPSSISSSTVSLALASEADHDLHIQWNVPDDQVTAIADAGTLPLKMRIYDVTGIDLNAQPAHTMQEYQIDTNNRTLAVSVPQGDRDYLADMGYADQDGQWHSLARSLHLRVPERVQSDHPPVTHDLEEQTMLLVNHPHQSQAPTAPPEHASLSMPSQHTIHGLDPATPPAPPFNPATCHRWFTVNAEEHCYQLNEFQVSMLLSTAQSTKLDPGSYLVTIEKSSVSDQTDNPQVSGEPLVMLWLHGGQFINKQTHVTTSSTWVSLNGLDDVLNLDVIESTTLSALFLNTHREDNAGEMTLLILNDD